MPGYSISWHNYRDFTLHLRSSSPLLSFWSSPCFFLHLVKVLKEDFGFLHTHKHTLFGDVWTSYINCTHINVSIEKKNKQQTKTLPSRLNWTTMSAIPSTKLLQKWHYELQITKRVALRITVRKFIFKSKVILNWTGSYRQQ